VKRLALSILVLAGIAVADDHADSSFVYPLQRLPLVFSHQKHLARGTKCEACHPTAAGSRSAVDNLLPTEAECRACHAIDRAVPDKVATPVAACTGCHPSWAPGKVVERTYLTPPPLKFAHVAHAATTCESCHAVRSVDLATTRQLPAMASCFTCHRSGSEAAHCADCHLTKPGGLVDTQAAHGELVPQRDGLGDEHTAAFARDHKQQASQVGATCNACHDRSECIACHQGVVKPLDFHPGDYLLVHATEARRGQPDCSACHRLSTFCVACHERSGLAMRVDTQFDAARGRPFHPDGWASPTGGMNLHAGEARRNIGQCASCHREEDCLTCHSAQSGSLRASPHPPGWRGSARCRALDRGNRRMCLRCHVTDDELGCDWHK
jgi:hypothetical protein